MDRDALINSVTREQHAAIAAWWQAFVAAEPRIDGLFARTEPDFDLVAFMATHLGAVSPELCWEFGPPLAGKRHRLVVTPEANRQLRPLVMALLQSAPPDSRFEFYPYRPPEAMAGVELTMKGRTGWANIAAIDYEIRPGRFNTFDLQYYLPWDGEERELAGKALVLTETVLGEERLDKWVGGIQARRKAEPGLAAKFGLAAKPPGRPIAGLRDDFEARIAAARAALKPFRHWVGNADTKWSLFKFEPEKAADYAGRDDIYVAPCASTDLMHATVQGGSGFYSERFSPDEIFIYLKMDGAADDLDQSVFADRSMVEDALNAALGEAGLGCTIGGGTGLRYSYVDMAVTDLAVTVPVIRQTLQDGRMTRRSWLLFLDADLRAEWIGIWDDSPMPPMVTG